jgi:hypothetical protein
VTSDGTVSNAILSVGGFSASEPSLSKFHSRT